YGLTGVLGWLPVTGLAIVVLIAGFQLRRLLNGLTTLMRPGTGSMMLGPMTRRIFQDLVSRAVTRRVLGPETANVRRREGRGSSGGQSDAGSSRRFRMAPAIGSGSAVTSTAVREYGGRRGDSQPALTAGPSVAPSVNGRTSAGDRFMPKPKQITAVQVPSAAGQTLWRTDKDKVKVPATTSASRGRQLSRPSTSQTRASRYEVSDHSHSASLRDGPPKAPREHRRPRAKTNSVAPKPFREYTKVSKQGTTILVPSGR
ncbi:MAG TPA: hypothetical protein VGJ38_17075, partial [Jatrophihabitantaceae bacterium]